MKWISRAEKIDSHLKKARERLKSLQTWRLSFGLVCFGLIIQSQITKGLYLELIALFGVLPLFIVSFTKSRRWARYCQNLEQLKKFYQQQLDFKNGVTEAHTHLDDMVDTELARDLDLHYLFDHLDRSFTQQAKDQLNAWICQNFADSERHEREDQIRQLAKAPGVIRRWQILSSHPEAKPKDLTDLERIGREVGRPFLESAMPWRWLIPLLWLALIAAIFLQVPSLVWKSLLLGYVGTTLAYLGATQYLFSRLQDLQNDFASLSERIQRLEALAPSLSFSPHLAKQEASRDTRSLGFYIALMSLRTNPILFYILNLLLPWEFVVGELSERARKKFHKHFEGWSEEVITIEVSACFANLKIYHPTTWATEDDLFFACSELAHPLINQDTVVANNFNPDQKKIIVITGSNMSGKSTFLRAVGMNLCLANIGAPVFAKELKFKPMELVSCIRVSDSLRDGQSYFYAEVKRMKKILEKAEENAVIFLIDEPLRGTNNQERLEGNQIYLQRILSSHGQGFLCTHDLELTKLANDSQQISNYHFSDLWENQNLFFDYKIKEGPSTTTNALKILEKEGLLL